MYLVAVFSWQKAKLEDGLSLAYATAIDGKYGGKFLMDHPDALIRARNFHSVPILFGFTKEEVTIWFTKCKFSQFHAIILRILR